MFCLPFLSALSLQVRNELKSSTVNTSHDRATPYAVLIIFSKWETICILRTGNPLSMKSGRVKNFSVVVDSLILVSLWA